MESGPGKGCQVAVEAPSSLITPARNMHAQPQMHPTALTSQAPQPRGQAQATLHTLPTSNAVKG